MPCAASGSRWKSATTPGVRLASGGTSGLARSKGGPGRVGTGVVDLVSQVLYSLP